MKTSSKVSRRPATYRLDFAVGSMGTKTIPNRVNVRSLRVKFAKAMLEHIDIHVRKGTSRRPTEIIKSCPMNPSGNKLLGPAFK